MKRIVVLLIITLFIFSLFGCGNGKSTENTDTDQYYLGSCGSRRIAEGPDAYYFINSNYLFYMDKEDLTPHILCTKPNCKHNEETDYDRGTACGAYHMFATNIIYYDNALYIKELKYNPSGLGMLMVLNKYNLQGELEKEITVLPDSAGSLIINNGILYYVYYGLDEDTTDNDWGDVYFMSYDISIGTETVLVQLPGTDVYSAGDSFAYKGKLYFRIAEFLDASILLTHDKFAIYDLETHEFGYLEPQLDDSKICTMCLYQDKLLYTEYKQGAEGGTESYDHDYCTDVYMANLDGTNAHKVAKIDYDCGLLWAFDNIMLVSNMFENKASGYDTFTEKIAIYKDFEKIGEFDLGDVTWPDGSSAGRHIVLSYATAGDDILFTKMHGNYALIGVKKSDLINGEANPFMIIEPIEEGW